MKPKNYTTVSYRFSLLDTNDQPVASMPCELQYLNANDQTWITFYTGGIKQGLFSFEELVTPPTGEARSVFLQDNRIPEFRIIPNPSIYNSAKQEVLAFTVSLTANPTAGTLAFDFGKYKLVEPDVLPAGDVFPDFLVISSRISLVNQMNNIRLIQSLQVENRKKDEQIKALLTDIKIKDATITDLNNQLLAALLQLEQKTLAVTRLETIRTQLEATILQLQQQVELLQQQLSIDSTPVPVSTLYNQLVQEIDASSRNNTTDFKLANISLKLKTLITRDANGINAQLIDLSTMDQLNGAGVSELVFDIAPLTTPAPQTGTMPNLLGFTETAVRKILTSLGLRLNPVFQNNKQVTDGDSFKQTPAEGSTYNTNDFVTVIFSKHE